MPSFSLYEAFAGRFASLMNEAEERGEDTEGEIDELFDRVEAIEDVLQHQIDGQLKSMGLRHLLLREEMLYTRRSLFQFAAHVNPELGALVREKWETDRREMLERILLLVEDIDPGIAAEISAEFEDDIPE